MVNDGISLWVPVMSTLAGGVLAGSVAILVSKLNHLYALEREKMAAEERRLREDMATREKANRELYFIATELIFLLEKFAEGCARVATDNGEDSADGERDTTKEEPVLVLTSVGG